MGYKLLVNDKKSFSVSVACLVFLLSATNVFPAGAAPQESGTPAESALAAATKKASLIVEGKGYSQFKPSGYGLKVTVTTEGKGRAATAAEAKRLQGEMENSLREVGVRLSAPHYMVWRRSKGSDYQAMVGPSPYDTILESVKAFTPPGYDPAKIRVPADAPDDDFKVTTEFSFSVESAEKARRAFAGLRATGAVGTVTLYGYGDEKREKAGRALALKAAIIDAKEHVKALSEAAKPKVFDLLYLQEGETSIENPPTAASLKGTSPLSVPDSLQAYANVTLFYGFKGEARN
jgi:uncharacterized protein YggE